MLRELLVARTGFEPVISALRGRRPEPLDERAKKREASSAYGWDGGSRTPIDGTRIRCPAIRRHPKVMRVTPQREEILYGNVTHRASINFRKLRYCEDTKDIPAQKMCEPDLEPNGHPLEDPGHLLSPLQFESSIRAARSLSRHCNQAGSSGRRPIAPDGRFALPP